MVRGVLSTIATPLALVLVTVAIYASSLGYGLVYEDGNRFALNPSHMQAPEGLHFRMIPQAIMDRFAVTPFPVRVLMLSAHLVTGILLAALASPFIAALFLWHPLQVESVAYLSSLPDVLGVLCLVAMMAALRSRAWIVAGCCGLLACGCKESIALGVVAALVLYGVPKVVWTSGAIGLAVFMWQTCPWCSTAQPLSARFASVADLSAQLGQSISRLVWPRDLSIFYGTPNHLWSLVLIGSTLAVAVWRPSLAIALALIFAPRLIVPTDGIHDHHWYLPMALIALSGGEPCAV